MRSPDRSPWRTILVRLAQGSLIAFSAGPVTAVAAYLMGPPRANPDPSIFVVVAAMTLGPGVALAWAARRARVARPLDLGKLGTNIFILVALVIAAILSTAGVYSLIRLVRAIT